MLESFNIYTIVLILVPGYIVKSILDRFVVTETTADTSYIILCILYGALNFAILSIFIPFFDHLSQPIRLVGWVIGLFILPALVGYFIALFEKRNLWAWVIDILPLGPLRIRPIHPTPPAWDCLFSDMSSRWILVRLIDGTVFRGFLGNKSFISSDRNERDLYMDEMNVLGADGNTWEDAGRGVYIGKDQISSIEIYDKGSA